jgi:hypothetical protein
MLASTCMLRSTLDTAAPGIAKLRSCTHIVADAILPLSYNELAYARRHRMQLSQSCMVVVVVVAMASCCDQAYRELHGGLLIL